jgi:hypothetical protein
MIRMRKIAVLLMMFCATPASAADLSAGEIQEQLVGQAIAWWDANGWMMGNLFLLPDGKAEISVEQPKPEHDAGQWTLQGNQICTEWSSMRDGRSKCYSVQETSPGHFLTSGGNKFEVLKIGV